jgi:hypothetical protein
MPAPCYFLPGFIQPVESPPDPKGARSCP